MKFKSLFKKPTPQLLAIFWQITQNKFASGGVPSFSFYTPSINQSNLNFSEKIPNFNVLRRVAILIYSVKKDSENNLRKLFLTSGEQVKEFSPLTVIPEKKENYIELKRYLLTLIWGGFWM